jgi:RecB family endonuclease NucS
MRLLVARCKVVYTGRLTAESTAAADDQGPTAWCSLHADAGRYKPLNRMTPLTVIEDEPRMHRRRSSWSTAETAGSYTEPSAGL